MLKNLAFLFGAKNGQNLAPSSRKWRKKNQIGENGGERKINPSVNPADGEIMFCYKVIRDLYWIHHLGINPIHRIGLIHTSDLSIYISSSGVDKFMFYLTIVNKILRHCHSWLARQ